MYPFEVPEVFVHQAQNEDLEVAVIFPRDRFFFGVSQRLLSQSSYKPGKLQ